LQSCNSALFRPGRGRELLLVLDNFEHVLDAAPLVAALLAAAPNVTVLATPGGPTAVTRRTAESPATARNRANSGSRPTVAVGGTGIRTRPARAPRKRDLTST